MEKRKNNLNRDPTDHNTAHSRQPNHQQLVTDEVIF